MKRVTVFYMGQKQEAYLHALFKAFHKDAEVLVLTDAASGSQEAALSCESKDEENGTGGRSSYGRRKKLEAFLQDAEGLFYRIRRNEDGTVLFARLQKSAPDGSAQGEGIFDLPLTERAKAEEDIVWKETASICEKMPAADGKEAEEAFKNFIYRCLSEDTGRTLPWGSLMGVRPTKIARMQIDAILKEQAGLQRAQENAAAAADPGSEKTLFSGLQRDRIRQYYKDRYYVSDKKAALAVSIAEREAALIGKLDPEQGISLYVGVPFCPTRCLYCSFPSNPVGACKELVEPCLAAMKKEIRQAAALAKGRKLQTVYIGGGTPTALSALQLRELMDVIAESFDLSTVLEYTVEAGRADSITREKLEVIMAGGAGRISVNPQSMNEETLSLIGRKATAAQTREAFLLARSMGFSHINMDLILGLPGENTAMVQGTLNAVEELSPDSMTVHSLAVKRGSDLHRVMTEKGITLSWDTSEAMEEALAAAERMGLLPYYLYRQKNMSGNQENVGFAKEGKYGLYNILIMEEVQSLIACGPGAISKRVEPAGPVSPDTGEAAGEENTGVRITRRENVKEVAEYIGRIDEMIARKEELFT